MSFLIRRILALILLISAIPFWLWVGLTTTVRLDELHYNYPVAGLWVSLAALIAQIYLATGIWPTRPTEAPRQLVRWIETRGCMAHIDHKVETGVVIREYMDKQYGGISEVHLEIKMHDDGRILRFPRSAFLLATDGALEYRW